jgi:iron complex outermembrane receptor protein
VGAVYDLPLREAQDSLRLMVYAGTRQVQQFQAIPVAPQSGAATRDGHPGGVIDFARAYGGLDARYTWRGALLDRALSLTGGVSLDDMRENRQGYQNFVGSLTGVQGELKRNERNRARNSDQYLQGQWALSEAWDLGLGVRHSRVRFESADQYIKTGNGDDSGAMRFSATTPTASLMYKASKATNLYVSAGRSFETPTLGEVAYQSASGTSTGWNLALKPSRGEHVEVGVKSQVAPGVQVNAAAFHVDMDDEIGVSGTGGRSVYRNVGRTERHGAEASAQWRISPQWQAYTALTWTSAHYQDASAVGSNVITPGHSLPGVPVRQVYAELGWRPTAAWQTALEVHHTGHLWADDANSAQAPASTLLAARAAWRHLWGDGWALDAVARVDNLTDQHAIGSVIVNEGNQRYFEPAPGRSLTVSLALRRAY